VGEQPEGFEGDQGQGLTDSINGLKTAGDDLKGAMQAKLGELEPLTLPTNVGTVSAWNVTLPGPLAAYAFTVDLAPFATPISIMRALLLMGVLIAAWFISVGVIRRGIG
jgi:hypothetical protein